MQQARLSDDACSYIIKSDEAVAPYPCVTFHQAAAAGCGVADYPLSAAPSIPPKSFLPPPSVAFTPNPLRSSPCGSPHTQSQSFYSPQTGCAHIDFKGPVTDTHAAQTHMEHGHTGSSETAGGVLTCSREAKWCDRQVAHQLWPQGSRDTHSFTVPRQIWHWKSSRVLLSAVV